MSLRNRPDAKQIRRLQRALKKGRLPAYVDLIKYLIDNRYADTAGQARTLILAEKVKSGSHTIGITWRMDKRGRPHDIVDREIPKSLMQDVVVNAPKTKPYYE